MSEKSIRVEYMGRHYFAALQRSGGSTSLQLEIAFTIFTKSFVNNLPFGQEAGEQLSYAS